MEKKFNIVVGEDGTVKLPDAVLEKLEVRPGEEVRFEVDDNFYAVRLLSRIEAERLDYLNWMHNKHCPSIEEMIAESRKQATQNIAISRILDGMPAEKIAEGYEVSLDYVKQLTHFNDRELMLQTDQVAQPLHCQCRKEKVPELSGAIQRCGVEDHMVVDVLPVRVRCHHKGVFALGKAHGQFVAHLVSLLCGDFPRTKGLPNLVGDDVTFLSAPGSKFILPLGKHRHWTSM